MIYITHKIFFRNIKPSIINFTTLKAALGEKYPVLHKSGRNLIRRYTYLFLHLVDHVLNVNAETLKLSLLGVLFVDQAQSSVQREEIIHVVLQLVKDVKLKSAVIVGACLVQVEEEKQVGPLVMLCSYMFLESLYLKNKNLLTI